MRHVVVYPDAATVADATAARVLLELSDTLSIREEAHWVLTGGTVGIDVLAAIGRSELRHAVAWDQVHVWWGDERWVPAGHADRNDAQADVALLAQLPIPASNVHRVASGDSANSAAAAAEAYANELARYGSPAPAFDILLLGLGPDGHVASLFPDHVGATDTESAVLAVEHSPKPPATRVSLGWRAIAQARNVWIVAAGESKAEAVKACLSGDETLPGSHATGAETTLWLIDAAAASAA